MEKIKVTILVRCRNKEGNNYFEPGDQITLPAERAMSAIRRGMADLAKDDSNAEAKADAEAKS